MEFSPFGFFRSSWVSVQGKHHGHFYIVSINHRCLFKVAFYGRHVVFIELFFRRFLIRNRFNTLSLPWTSSVAIVEKAPKRKVWPHD